MDEQEEQRDTVFHLKENENKRARDSDGSN